MTQRQAPRKASADVEETGEAPPRRYGASHSLRGGLSRFRPHTSMSFDLGLHTEKQISIPESKLILAAS
ncbi:hypothetical protein HBI64_200160 [Parastagonospora nodorum]|nr:hypothetical protein HBH49_224450 [Parastagonospora nodorum]KAH4157118.1 hypothetical protein HBH43_203040 [Parastagonospora nodorum]KAH5100039.1 hypothetical protein HBH71_233710 [Parastagonospora nodorum]KAH5241685.1 hypothetical protein HBI72_202490 [Parastagonospora nodorum]KAH5290862.1 hypothetical protein HBI11_206020 [Parastagonospora nodorum]